MTVILDDDPTGTQTVHGLYVLTNWSVPLLTQQLATGDAAFFILTNARALPPTEAFGLIQTICQNLRTASAGRSLTVILRGDSTLRGHFPTEPVAVEAAFGCRFDKWLLCPFFEEGGRLTVQGVHYVREGETLVPVAQTPFARDHAFGYRSSDLRAWVQEKTSGAVRAESVGLLTLDEIRQQPLDTVVETVRRMPKIWVADAVTMADVAVVAAVCRRLEAEGVRLLYRTAASFVQAYLGIEKRPLLRADELIHNRRAGGLVVVGSYVPRTTAQLEHLRTVLGIDWIEVNVARLLETGAAHSVVEPVTEQMNASVRAGRTAVLYTSRQLMTDSNVATNLAIGRRVSEALVSVVQGLTVEPRFLIAKGGITSSDVATNGLGVQQALILGQALPGVPVWQLGQESRFPGLRYVVFPGNVGDDSALVELVNRLM